MTIDDLMATLDDLECVVLEPRDQFDRCIIGIAKRADGMMVAAYDEAKVIATFRAINGWSHEAAVEWYEYNTAAAWMGDGSPVFVQLASVS